MERGRVLLEEDTGFWVLARPEVVIAQSSIDPEKILEKQFKTASIKPLSNKIIKYGNI